MRYLSPSTFLMARNCEWKAKLLKVDRVIDEDKLREENTSMAMSCGTAFDVMVKSALNRRLNRDTELTRVIPQKHKAAIELARVMYSCYEGEPLRELKDEGIGYSGVEQEIEIEWKGKKSILMGMPDLVLTDGTIVDWKCKGMFGRGYKPVDGYIRCYVYAAGHNFNHKDMGPSGKCDTPMEEINPDWAIQTYLYARLLGHPVGMPLRCGIENICIDSDTVLYCASYRNPITLQFQEKIEDQFHDVFHRLTTNTVEKPRYEKWKCAQYGKQCLVAEYCDTWKRRNEVVITTPRFEIPNV